MTNERIHDSATSNLLAWSQGAHMQHDAEDEVAGEVDEPPDEFGSPVTLKHFKRTTIRKQVDSSLSLLTKALHHHSDDEDSMPLGFSTSTSRRRSMNSNISLASTAELTSDTGLTSPARTNTPSPPPPVIKLGNLNSDLFDSKPKLMLNCNPHGVVKVDSTPVKKVDDVTPLENPPKDAVVEVSTKKRCISFACAAKPEAKKPTSPLPPTSPAKTTPTPATEKPAQRKTCIKFACPAKPAKLATPPQIETARLALVDDQDSASTGREGSPSTVGKYRSPSTGRSRRSPTPRRSSNSPLAIRKKYLTANATDLNCESSRFHEFACDELREDDWIRQNLTTSDRRLTINDTLQKENEIRRLGKEAEEEALQEEEDDEELDNDGDEDEDEADNHDDEDDLEEGEEIEDDDNDDDDDDDELSGYGTDDDGSDGYNTDNEIGFADSDDDGDGGELDLWTHGQAEALQMSGATPINRRRPSVSGNRSDSSTSSEVATSRGRDSRQRSRRIKIRPGTPELPDSTDFVCGTLDEDRPLEDAYISCIAQKRREKTHIIPQDIDPSFPTSDPEDEDDEPLKPASDSSDHVWIHGELEDLHHEQDRTDRRKKRGNLASPRRLHSPPPKRHPSPAPKARGRSPKRLFERHSPRRIVSPPPSGRLIKSSPASPAQNAGKRQVEFKTLAFRPVLTHTKSLPRAPAMFPPHFKGQRRRQAAKTGVQGHVRGAIDIVKGLEHKRQRRKEKFFEKKCNRARKGQMPEKRAQPGQGAERMKNIGLLMAGKITPGGNYVLSI